MFADDYRKSAAHKPFVRCIGGCGLSAEADWTLGENCYRRMQNELRLYVSAIYFRQDCVPFLAKGN